ncbi:MAG: hypothetical protein ABL897_14655 [Hyphomicrobium sp.]
MQSIEFNASEATAATAAPVAAPVSASWFVRRAVLWFLIVALAVGASCLLYMAASKAEAESISRMQPHRVTAPVVRG